MKWTVYLLKCADGKHYVGCTYDLNKRLYYHAKGRVSYTKKRLPVEVMVTICFKDKYLAYKFEKYLKSGSGIAFRQRHFQ